MWVTAAQRCDTNGSGPTCEPQPTFMLNEEYSLPWGPHRVWPGQMKLWVRSLFGNEAESFTCIAISGRVCPCWPALRHVMVLYWAFVQQDVSNPLNSLWRRGHCTSVALRRSPEGTPFWQNSTLGIFYALHLFSSLNSSSVKPHDTLGGSDTTVISPLRSQCLEIEGFPMDSSGNGGPETWTRVFNTTMWGTVTWLHCWIHVFRLVQPPLREPARFGKTLPVFLVTEASFLVSQESSWEGDLVPVLSFCRNFSSARQVLRGGCRLDFTSTSALFIFASSQYYQLLLHMEDPYCALVKWYHIMLLCLYHQTLLMKKSPGLPRFICSIYFSQTLFWIKHLR